MSDETSDIRGDKIATMEQALRRRIHDVADDVRELETWKATHTIEDESRFAAVGVRFDSVDAHLKSQDVAAEKRDAKLDAVGDRVNRWGAVIAALLVIVPLAFGIMGYFKK